ncbi:MAG: TadE/TadG family type IV pilus assembly protein [Armatimonadota bacterium]
MVSRLRIDRRQGAASVEMALLAPLLIYLLFAVIEFGVMVGDVVHIHQVAREGARAAVVGATPTTIDARVEAAAAPMDTTGMQTVYEFRSYDIATGTWSEWQTLGTEDTANNASPDDQVRATITYPHKLLLPGLFGTWADDPESGTITLKASIIMRRE